MPLTRDEVLKAQHVKAMQAIFEAHVQVERAIAATPTSELRNDMTNVNVALLEITEKLRKSNHGA